MKRRDFLSLLSGITFLGLFSSSSAKAQAAPTGSRYYKGPVTDHFDGTHFFNPWEKGRTKTFFDFLKYRMGTKRTAWPESFPFPHFDKPPAHNNGDSVRASYVGHASFLIQIAGMNILCDPVWSERASPFSFIGPKRVNPPGIKFEDLPPIDLVLISHNHYDHLDVDTIKKLHHAFKPKFITPLGNDTIIKEHVADANVITGDWYDHVDVNHIRIHFEPTHHWSARGTGDRREALWASFVIESGAKKILFIGDTGFGEGNAARIIGKRHAQIDVAFIPIGAYEPQWFMSNYHVNPAEAVKVMELVNAKRAIAHHWGTFQLTDEAITKPIEDLRIALQQKNMDEATFIAIRPGQAEILDI